MLLSIEKIKDEVAKDPNTGERLNDPRDPQKFITQEVIKRSSININDIEEIRPFEKDGKKHKDVEGDITVIHKYKHLGGKSSEVHVKGNYLDIIAQCNALKKGETTTGQD